MIAAFLISWFALTGASYFVTPIIPYFSPDPLVSGYIGYYSGIIAFGLIPLVLLIWLLFKVIWGYKVGYRTRRFTLAAWMVSFVLFASTVLFTIKNFVHEEHSSQLVYDQEINFDEPVLINLESSYNLAHQNHDRILFDIDDLFITRKEVYLRRVNFDIHPADSTHMIVKRSAHSFGKNQRSAKVNLNRVNHNISLTGNEIAISDYVKLNRGDRYRLQSYNYRIAIPLGTEVIFKGDRDMIPHRSIKKGSKRKASMIYTMTKEGLVPKEIIGENL